MRIELCGRSLDACVDTGFNGSLLIPADLAQGLNLDYRFGVSIETATGEISVVPVYEAEMGWLGMTRRVEVLAAEVDFVLLGMKLLEAGRLEMEPAKGYLKISSP